MARSKRPQRQRQLEEERGNRKGKRNSGKRNHDDRTTTKKTTSREAEEVPAGTATSITLNGRERREAKMLRKRQRRGEEERRGSSTKNPGNGSNGGIHSLFDAPTTHDGVPLHVVSPGHNGGGGRKKNNNTKNSNTNKKRKRVSSDDDFGGSSNNNNNRGGRPTPQRRQPRARRVSSSTNNSASSGITMSPQKRARLFRLSLPPVTTTTAAAAPTGGGGESSSLVEGCPRPPWYDDDDRDVCVGCGARNNDAPPSRAVASQQHHRPDSNSQTATNEKKKNRNAGREQQRRHRLPTDGVSEDFLDHLDEEMWSFRSYVGLTQDEYDCRLEWVRHLQRKAQELFAHQARREHVRWNSQGQQVEDSVRFQIFGSFATPSVCTFTSDVDLALWGVVPTAPPATALVASRSAAPNKKKGRRSSGATGNHQDMRATTTTMLKDEEKKRQKEEKISKWLKAIGDSEEVEGEQEEKKEEEQQQQLAASNHCTDQPVTTTPAAATSKGPPHVPDTKQKKQEQRNDAQKHDNEGPLFIIDRVGEQSLAQDEGEAAQDEGPQPYAGVRAAPRKVSGGDEEEKEADKADSAAAAAAATSAARQDRDHNVDDDKNNCSSSTATASDEDTADKLESLGNAKSSRKRDAPVASFSAAATSSTISDMDAAVVVDVPGRRNHQNEVAVTPSEGEEEQDCQNEVVVTRWWEDDEADPDDGIFSDYKRLVSDLTREEGAEDDVDGQFDDADDYEEDDDNDLQVCFVASPQPRPHRQDQQVCFGPRGVDRDRVVSALGTLARALRKKRFNIAADDGDDNNNNNDAGVEVDRRSVQFIRFARVPIVKLKTSAGFETDIAVGGHNGTDTSLFAAEQVRRYQSFSPVVLFLKVLLTQQGLDVPFEGGLGSYKLYVLLAHHLQRHLAAGGRDRPSEILMSFMFRYGQVSVGVRGKQHHKNDVSSEARTKLHQDVPLQLQEEGDDDEDDDEPPRTTAASCGATADLSNVYMLHHCVQLFRHGWERLWRRSVGHDNCTMPKKQQQQHHAHRRGASSSVLADLIHAARLRQERQDCRQMARRRSRCATKSNNNDRTTNNVDNAGRQQAAAAAPRTRTTATKRKQQQPSTTRNNNKRRKTTKAREQQPRDKTGQQLVRGYLHC